MVRCVLKGARVVVCLEENLTPVMHRLKLDAGNAQIALVARGLESEPRPVFGCAAGSLSEWLVATRVRIEPRSPCTVKSQQPL